MPIKNEWQLEAQCLGTTSDIFFPDPHLKIDDKYRLDQMAKEICGLCEVEAECLEYAITNPYLVRSGTWGGKTYKEIKRLRRRRGYATNVGRDSL